MTAAAKREFGMILRASVDRTGGPLFALALALTSAFTLALFELRADKIFSLPETYATATAEDAVAFKRAADLAAAGQAADAYEPAAFRETLNEANGGLLWLNPPHAFLVAAPFAQMNYAAVKAAFIALTVLGLCCLARLAAPGPEAIAALLLSPAAFAALLVMQTGPLVALGLCFALTLADRRPLLAGLALCLLTLKPQYGLMAPIFLAARGDWRAFAAAAIFSALLAGASWLAYGAAPWAAFFDSARTGALSAHAANIHRDMLSMGQTLGKLGAGAELRRIGDIAVVFVCAAGTFATARRWQRKPAAGITLLLSAASAPSFWVYDWALIAAGLLLLARLGGPWPAHLQILAALLWMGPLFSLGIGTMASSLLAPALLVVALVAFTVWGDGGVQKPRARSADKLKLREPPASP